MNIEKWVKDKGLRPMFSHAEMAAFLEIAEILNADFAIVPREASEDIAFDIWNDCTSGYQMNTAETKEMYLEVIKAAENE